MKANSPQLSFSFPTLRFHPRRPEDLPTGKYELVCSQRINHSSRDEAFNCMGSVQDSQGIRGTFLQKSVLKAVPHAVLDNAEAIVAQAFPTKVTRLPASTGSSCLALAQEQGLQ